MSVVISLNKLSKNYGNSRGITDISFDISRGEVFGFLGPNGAGKTTALRTLVGLIKATSGSARILCYDALHSSSELRSKIGYLPGSLSLYKNYTGLELLHFLAKMRQLNCDDAIKDFAQRLNLDLNRKIGDLSQGNRQKVGVIQAFMHKPEVLLLDEPTGGLDPLSQRAFEDMLDEVQARGATIMLSSHVLSEVEHLADRIAIVNEGRLLVVEHISVLKERAIRKLDLNFDTEVSIELFKNITSIKDLQSHGTQISCSVIGSETEVLKVAVENNVRSVNSHETSLEEIFLDLVAKEVK
ncbi:unannotated protein [freshwater metagenome]|uniref:Unannotated protein n=1 Tax=freshwater metagenome TaxID=449393 RepID=A0A6J7XTG5_9ZZZZ